MKLRTNQIRTDGGTQPRAGLNHETINEYADAMRHGDQFPPITVFHDGTDYWLADGFHRYSAHIKAFGTHSHIKADIHQGTQRDAILYAVGANANHGLRRTPTDKKRATLRLLQDDEWRNWSDREIARRCRVSPTFVGKIRATLTVHVDSERRTYTTKHGTTATMQTANIGAATVAETANQSSPLPVVDLETAVSAWLDNGGTIDQLEAIKAKDLAANWRTSWDAIKATITGQYRDNHLYQAINNVLARQPNEPHYTEIWQLEISIYNWLRTNAHIDASTSAPIGRHVYESLLPNLTQNNNWRVGVAKHLTEPYRETDIIQAINNVAHQLRQRDTELAESKTRAELASLAPPHRQSKSGEKMNKWKTVSVNVNAPEFEYHLVYVCWPNAAARPAIRLAYYDSYDGCWRTPCGKFRGVVTHWQLLPDPPPER